MSELPPHFKDLVAPLGLNTDVQWGPELYKRLRAAWEELYARARGLKPTKKQLNSFVSFIVSLDKKRMQRVGLVSEVTKESIFKLFCDMYPRYFPNPKPNKPSRPKTKSITFRAKGPSTTPKRTGNKKSGIVQIGFGLASTYKPKRVDLETIVMDEHTKPGTKADKSIIYTPGWSINGAFDDKS